MTQRVRECDGEVLAATRAMYASYGDRPAFDGHLHPEVTIWESEQPGPLIGLPELDALRDGRPASPEVRPPVLAVLDPVVDRWGDVAVIRYVLCAEVAGTAMEFRVTDVLDGSSPATDGAETRWRIVHHHAEQIARPGDGSSPPARAAAD